jgi:hypothetical protein
MAIIISKEEFEKPEGAITDPKYLRCDCGRKIEVLCIDSHSDYRCFQGDCGCDRRYYIVSTAEGDNVSFRLKNKIYTEK